MTIDELIARDKVCHICGKGGFDARSKARRPTRDHLTPRSKGGPGTDDNIKLAHWRCNQVKGDS